MLSVPPEVMFPAAPSGAWRSDKPMATTSSSMRFRLGKASGPSAFSDWYMAYASLATRITSSPGLNTYTAVRAARRVR